MILSGVLVFTKKAVSALLTAMVESCSHMTSDQAVGNAVETKARLW